MAINFHPKPGMVLICNYSGFMLPEMVKIRPVIIVSPYQLNNKGLCTVVPISTSPPEPIEHHHYKLPAGKYKFLHLTKDCWVKCDMIGRVSLKRLDRIRVGKDFVAPNITRDDLFEIRKGIKFTIDI